MSRKFLLLLFALIAIALSLWPEPEQAQVIGARPGGASIRTIAKKAGYSRVNGYDLGRLATDHGNWAAIASDTSVAYGTTTDGDVSYEFIVGCHKARSRQHGTVRQAKFYVRYLGDVTAWYVTIWRRNGSGTYDVVDRENVLSQLTAPAVNTVNVSLEGVRPGDFYGHRIEFAGVGKTTWQMMCANTAGIIPTADTLVVMYRKKNIAYDGTAVDWEGVLAANKAYNALMKTELYMDAVNIIWTGDSNIAGHKGASGIQNFTFSETVYWPGSVHADSVNVDSTIADVAYDSLGYTYQLMAKGGHKVSQILNWAYDDIIALNPAACVISVGGNDAYAGTTCHTFYHTYDTLLDSLLNNDIECYVMEIPPMNKYNGITAARLDSFNLVVAQLAREKSDCYWIPCHAYIATYDSAGYTGNTWDAKQGYIHADSVHVNVSCFKRMRDAFITWGLKLMN